jgi:hypothetical protein
MEFLEFRRFWESEGFEVTQSYFSPYGCHYFIRDAVLVGSLRYSLVKRVISGVYTKKEIKRLNLEDLQQHLCSFRLRQLFE